MYIYSGHHFNTIITISLSKKQHLYKEQSLIIPAEWKSILMNEGSFTQNLSALTGEKINIKMIQKYNNHAIKLIRNIRIVWLDSFNYSYMTFARSFCALKEVSKQQYNLYQDQPIGKLFIDSNTDIHKDINEIYYGYSYYLEQKFQSTQPIWGRKYTLYYKKQSYITIQEFFSPNLKYLIQN